MSVFYPSPTSSCRVDLLVASYQQVYNAIRCDRPTLNLAIVSEIAQQIYAQALLIRGASSILSTAAPSIVKLVNTATSQLNASLPGLFDTTRNILNNITAATTAVNNQRLAAAQAQETSLINQVTSNIGVLLGGAGNAVSDTINKVTSGVSGLLAQGSTTVGNLVNAARSGIGSLINSAEDVVGTLVNRATSGVGGIITGAGAAIGRFARSATEGIGDVLDDAGAFLGGVINTVGRGIGTFLADAGSTLGQVIGAIQRGATTALGVAGDTIGAVAAGVRNFIADLIGNVQTGIAGIVERLSSIPGAVAQLGSDLIENASGAIGPILDTIGTFLSDPLQGIIGGFFHGEEARVLEVVDRLYARLESNPETPDDVRAAVTSARRPGAPIPAILGVLVVPIVLGALLGGAFGPVVQKIVQEENIALRPSLLSLGDVVQANYRGVLSNDGLNAYGARLGFTTTDINRALTLGAPQPTPIDLADWTYRQLQTKSEFVARLEQLGYTSGDVTKIIEASAVIPNVSDLVRFAVRESFPGQSAFDGPRGAGAPARFIESAGWHGLDPEFARSYWAAHWDLPSVTAAFSMYHRRFISEVELRALLREQDLAPEWVDRLIDVAFDPLTRVDVRRMRALGVLQPIEVRDAYLDLGYSPTNAQRLADFVEADITASREVETAPERDLTRADIVGAYADGILARPAATGALQSLGYSDDETALILDREDIRQLRAERRETRAAIVEQAVAGIIDAIGLQDKMSQAAYTDDEIKAALREVERKIDATIRQPTKAELDRFRKLKLLNDVDYADELRRLGYAERWIPLFLKAGTTPEA